MRSPQSDKIAPGLLTLATGQSVSHMGYFNPMHKFLARDTRITILEGPFTGQKGWVSSEAFQEPTGSHERGFAIRQP